MLDDVSLFIISEIYNAFIEKRIITTYDIAKKYNWVDKSSERFQKSTFYSKKSALITYKLERLASLGYIEIKNNGSKKEYILDGQKIIKINQRFLNGKTYRIAPAIHLKHPSGKWIIFEI